MTVVTIAAIREQFERRISWIDARTEFKGIGDETKDKICEFISDEDYTDTSRLWRLGTAKSFWSTESAVRNPSVFFKIMSSFALFNYVDISFSLSTRKTHGSSYRHRSNQI